MLDRFLRKVRVDQSGCWLWTGAKFHFGHGAFYQHGKQRKAHRIAWEVWRGPIPEGMNVLHKCDVPSCVNPEHLFLGTQADNMADRNSKGRQARGETGGRAKLTKADVLAIRVDPRPNTHVAVLYGVTDQLVSKIRHRRLWAHV